MAALLSRASGRAAFKSLDVAVAALAAASVGFLVYAMPADLFSGLVAATGLPDLLPAAEPPLGMKARFAVVAIAALLCFLAVWALLGALDSLAARKPHRAYVQVRPEAPRQRRLDAHPDAPPRPPVLAGQEFGEPVDWLTDQGVADEAAGEWETVHRAAEPTPVELQAEAEPEFEAGSDPLILSAPLPQWLNEEPATLASAQPDPTSRPALKRGADIHALADALPEASETSVTNLMQRLEGGLARRERAPAAEPQSPPAAETGTGHRLRNAINDLERMAKRN